MTHQNKALSILLQRLDLGYSMAEEDTLLEAARIETSAFTDLLNDRVDLIPGTKGSGKSALFRIFVDFLPDILLRDRKVVVAHGVQAPGDPVFHAFTEQFAKLSETEFVSFWCIYLVSLAHEHFIKGPRYDAFLRRASAEIHKSLIACAKANIPQIQAKRSLRDVLERSLHVLGHWRPKLKLALSENLTKQPLLRNFLHPLNREELDVGHRHPLGLQQQIPQVLIAPAAVNQHTNVPVHRFHHSEAY